MIALLLALGTAAVPPPSAHWTIIAESDRGVMAMDVDGVVADGHRRSVWTRASTIDDDGLAMTMVVLADIDCAGRTWAKARLVALDEQGRATEDRSVDTRPLPIRPDTPSQALFDRLCR